MRSISTKNFGLLIAYVIPGFLALVGVSLALPALGHWLIEADSGPTVGGFMYVSLASISAGMIASVIRWALIDSLHHLTGIERANLDFSRITNEQEGFEVILESHYRYYQFYGNTCVVVMIDYLTWRTLGHGQTVALDIAALALWAVLFFGSRDALRRYYSRATHLLGVIDKETDHDQRRRTPRGKHKAK